MSVTQILIPSYHYGYFVSTISQLEAQASRLRWVLKALRADTDPQAFMSAVNMSTEAGQALTHWDIGLSKSTAGVIRARLSLYGDGLLCDFVQALQDLRLYIALGSASRRAASPTLESTLATVLSPLLQEFYAQENTYDVLKELLDIVGAHKRHRSLLPVSVSFGSMANSRWSP